MAAVAGWADLAGGVGRRPHVTGEMLAALARRGDDNTEVWQDDRAGLGWATRRPAGAAGPAPVVQAAAIQAAGRHRLAIAYDGHLSNAGELRRELGRQGRRLDASSEAECLLHAYLVWGPCFARQLSGSFACALWDAQAGRLLLIRDRLGIKPLYYALIADGVLFGSEASALFAHPDFEPVVTIDGLRELLAPHRQPAASIWRGMAEVPAATTLVIDSGGCTSHSYWQLRAEPMADDLDEAAAAVRELLGDAVDRQLERESPACLLSGGLDSSAIAALARDRLAAEATEALRTYTVSFTGYVENFQPEFSSVRPAPDAPFADEVARRIGSDHSVVELAAAELAAPAVRQLIWTASDRLPSQCDLSRVLYLLYRGVGARHETVLSGDGADELFGEGPVPDPEAAASARTFPILAWSHGVPHFSVLRRELEAQLDISAHIDRLHEAALGSVPSRPGDTAYDRCNREMIYLVAIWDINRGLERDDRLGNAAGIEIRHPFLDHRVVELAFNASYRLHTFDGREKSLLRSAMTGLLPASVLSRQKSHLPTPQDPEYNRAIEQDFRDLIARPDAPLFDLADHGKLRWLAKNIAGKSSVLYLRRAREDALALNGWLEVHGSRLRL